MKFKFVNAKIYRRDGFAAGTLYVKDGQISAPLDAAQEIDCQGGYLAPGLIDLQVNGIGDIDFTLKLETEKASPRLFAQGVTSYLATIVSQPLECYRSLLASYSEAEGCLGVHLEGPHLNPRRAGGHPKEAILPVCEVEFWKKQIDPRVVKMVTLAPELEQAEAFIALLHKNKILVACGHTEATGDELERAKRQGLRLATHLFNAMAPFHHRKSGPIGYVLGRRALDYSLIVDDVHLNPDTVALAYNAHPEGLLLVSDASGSTLAGMPLTANAELSGTTTLAGSHRFLLDAVRLLHKQAPCPLHEAIRAASSKPAQLLQIDHKKGHLEEGFDADLILLSPNLALQATYVKGQQKFPV